MMLMIARSVQRCMQQHPAFVVKGFQKLVCRMNLHVQVQDGALIAAPLLCALSDKSRFGLSGGAVAKVLFDDAAIGLPHAVIEVFVSLPFLPRHKNFRVVLQSFRFPLF